MPGPSPPPSIKPLAQMTRRELAIDLLLLTALGGGSLAVLVAGVWAIFTRPDRRGVAAGTAALAAVAVPWLASLWAERTREWRRRARAEPDTSPDRDSK